MSKLIQGLGFRVQGLENKSFLLYPMPYILSANILEGAQR